MNDQRVDLEQWRLEAMRRYADMVLADAVAYAKERGRAVFRTGDRTHSMLCLTEHLDPGQRYALRELDRYVCPQCGFLLKDRGLR